MVFAGIDRRDWPTETSPHPLGEFSLFDPYGIKVDSRRHAELIASHGVV